LFDRQDADIEDNLRPSELVGLDWIALHYPNDLACCQ